MSLAFCYSWPLHHLSSTWPQPASSIMCLTDSPQRLLQAQVCPNCWASHNTLNIESGGLLLVCRKLLLSLNKDCSDRAEIGAWDSNCGSPGHISGDHGSCRWASPSHTEHPDSDGHRYAIQYMCMTGHCSAGLLYSCWFRNICSPPCTRHLQ